MNAIQKIWAGGAVAAVAVGIAVFVFDLPPKSEDVLGTVVPAERYRAPQAGAEAVKLGPTTTAPATAGTDSASAGFDANVAPITPAEDFSLYQARVPGVFFFLGVDPPDADRGSLAPNHSPRFFVDERALPTGVRALASVAIDFLYRGDQNNASAAAARP